MQLSTRQQGDVSIIDVSGKNPGERSVSIREVVERLHAAGQIRIVLNLAELEYLDSSGLGDLVSFNMKAAQSGRPLKVAAMTRRLSDMLRVMRLASTFEIYETVDDAIASFPPAPPPAVG
jgi:anti-sigma B factor antagonist